jgi:asparagine synthase (glutamine-hydrolysing)
MCGIAGTSGAFPPELLRRMAHAVRHRGPDDEGFDFVDDGRVGLAQRRLAIIDLSPAGHQPMWDEERSVAIVYNGELYNFRELRKELENDGFRFRSQSDTEVLLQMYRRDGEAMLTKLNGIFAFAIWDARARTLFLARDPLGVKPLYYTRTPSGFLFASEIKALLECREVDRTLDLAALDRHLHLLWSPAPDTALAHVKKLEPGCALAVRDGRIARSWRYYDLPYDQPIDHSLTAERAAEELRERLATAVRRQMIADVPVGAFLSGGLDSSSVVAYAAREVPRDSLRCFTIGFQDPAAVREGMAEDLPYAERVAKHLGVKLDTVWVGPEMAERLPEMIWHLDEPQADPAPINALLICELAREHGIKVLLSGAGGDDLFTGYRRHTALLAERAWAWLPRPARAALRAATSAIPVGRRAAKAFAFADESEAMRIARYFDWAPRGATASIFSAEARASLTGRDAMTPLLDAMAALPANTPALNRMLMLESRFFLADHNLNYTDKMAMARGVEVRVPLLDPELVAFAARLPLAFKQRGTTGKWIFKRAMEPLLPRDVIYRNKTGFGAPLRHWLAGPLAPLVDDVLSEASLRRRGVFDHAGVRALAAADRGGRVDGTYTLFALVCIELWCRLFVDGEAFAGAR